jgi:hypothetical protein
MSGIHDVFKVGDEVYFVESRWMAFCRIKKIVHNESRPDYVEYVLEILKLPYHNEYFKPLNTMHKRFSVGRTSGVYFSGMWYFYSPQQFEKYYSEYDVVMISWAKYVIPRLITLTAMVTICIMAVCGCYAVMSLFHVFR